MKLHAAIGHRCQRIRPTPFWIGRRNMITLGHVPNRVTLLTPPTGTEATDSLVSICQVLAVAGTSQWHPVSDRDNADGQTKSEVPL